LEMSIKSLPIWVVKLGGSLYKGRTLRGWLEALAAGGRGKVVVVPGGGPFADQVRVAQERWRFDDVTGHRMAILGMAQYGLMLTGLQSKLIPAKNEADIQKALGLGCAPVWIPTELESLDVPRNWSVTSDSLAAWLALRLQANHLVLIKSVKLTMAQVSAGELARRGIIDETFPELLSRAGCSCQMVAAQDYASIATALDGVCDCGTRLTP
jgi:5-(aminomethyl)-3-furanmethanol phosphate kinase